MIQETLTKENFWNATMEQFPKATTLFCKWIDQYKASVNWNALFSSNENTMQLHSSKYKFHEIPYEMQQGIWICFCYDTLDDFFEQSEYSYSGDLEEDIKQVFAEIEPLIDDEY